MSWAVISLPRMSIVGKNTSNLSWPVRIFARASSVLLNVVTLTLTSYCWANFFSTAGLM